MDDDTTFPPLTLGRSLWAIRQDALPRILEAHRAGPRGIAQLLAHTPASAPKAARRSSSRGQRAGGSVAVVPLTGVITPRASFLSFLFGGGGGLLDFRESFQEAILSPDVGAIVIDVDSPGGLIDLVPEVAAEIRDARGTKPIIAVANTQASSAAYWLACQADEVVITPSGCAGSIGVYRVHDDWSGYNEKLGVIPTYIAAGKYKVEGNPDEPMSDDATREWQQSVDDLYGMFIDDVAAGRGVTAQQVRDGYGEGRQLLAARALQAGLVDRIATLEEVVADLLTNNTGNGPSATEIAAQRRAEARARAAAADSIEIDLDDDEDDEDDDPEQPRCSCGRYVVEGEDQCEDCKAASAAQEDEPGEEDDDEPDDDEDDDEGPEADAQASARAIAGVFFD